MATQYIPSTPQHCGRGLLGINSPLRPVSSTKQRDRPMFHSPRCENPDKHFVAPPDTLKTHEDRWHHMSQQAGAHQQDDSVLTLTRRVSPQSLRSGVPPQVAARVRDLRLDINEKDNLPEWLDVIAALFFQLEHLHLSQMPCDNSDASRMRRLYVLYRLPGLKSIDEKVVTELERQLARPSSPNGHRVQREEWVSFESFTFDSEDTNDLEEEHGDAVEVSLKGVVKRTHADIPTDELDASDWECPLKLSREVTETKHEDPEIRSGTPVSDAYQCAMNRATCGGLSLPAFENHQPDAQDGNASSQDLQTPLNPPPEPLETPPRIKPANEAAATISSAESTPERLIAEATCISSSLTLSSPFPLIFRGDGTLEELLQRNKTVSPPSVNRMVTEPFVPTSNPPSNTALPPQRPTHGRSLSSPFPMQFRKKREVSPPPNRSLSTTSIDSQKPESPSGCKEETEEINSVETSLAKDGPGSARQLVHPTQSPPSTEGRKVMPVKCSPEKRTPARITVSRPPKCPASRRTPPIPVTRKGKRFGCWRPRRPVRSKSIVDDADDDSSTDEEEEAELADTQGQGPP